ncbi:MAG: hypothetical protein KA158_09640, partial [Leucobacter sp.]|nr:hypothetical protein [Leucobacter sp.]
GGAVATTRKALRAVSSDERAVKPKTVTEAAAYGTTRELLAAMRERIAAAVQDPNCPPRDLAALTRRLHEIVRDIEAIDARADDEATRTAVTDAPFDAAAI